MVFHKKVDARELANTLREFSASFCEKPLSDADIAEISSDSSHSFVKASSLRIKDEMAGQAFWSLRDFADQLAVGWRWPCLLFYGIGLSLIVVVFIQNMLYVGRQTLSDLME